MAPLMRAICLCCVICLCGHAVSGQLKFGGQAGLQVSAFANGVGRPGWKASALASYGFKRLRLSEQVGVTTDRCSSSISQLRSRNMWKYVWADATSIMSYVPFRRENFDLSIGSGISIRRILSNTLDGDPNMIYDFDSRMYNWSYFLPARIGANFQLPGGREIACVLEYQVQLRDLHSPPTVTHQYEYTDWVNQLHSVNLSVGYLFRI
jgi:hypothetical protein